MSERYRTSHYAGSVFVIIDTASSEKMNMEDACRELNEQADRLNALERENADLNAELTETIAAVSDLMDENADLNHQLAEAYERCAQICNRLADESSTTFVRAMSESIEENKMRIARMQGLKTAEEEIRALIPKEATDE